uniref:Uncharacterized protein n=1 Tax=Arundo donax TaxID=35708 RepID=A0A0A9GXU4_ARUDO
MSGAGTKRPAVLPATPMAGHKVVAQKGSTTARNLKASPPAAPPPPPAPTTAAMDFNADADASMEDAHYMFDEMAPSGQSFTNLLNGSMA